MIDLAGRIALVTGGSRGIGKAIVLRLAAQGADVAFSYRGNEAAAAATKSDIEALGSWQDNRGKAEKEIAFRPARVLMQDFTGVPAVVDLAAMRDAR